jgi:hypothetical protein
MPPATRAVQACHAGIELARSYPHHLDDVPWLVLVGVADEAELRAEIFRLSELGLLFHAYKEPDMNNETTAAAFGPVAGGQRKAFRKLKLLES